MRLKALLKYCFSTIRIPVIIFTACFMGATLAGSVLNMVVGVNAVILGSSRVIDGEYQKWSTGIVAFAIFMLVSSLIGSQKDTRFLITRSVSRKEIFAANALFIPLLAAVMSALQVASIYMDGFVRMCLGADWRGLALDIQIFQAPDMNNPLVFFAVSFSVLTAFGAVSYLFGSLLARWKICTLTVLSALFVLLICLVGNAGLAMKLLDVLRFIYLDGATGLLIAVKQVLLASAILAAAFPVMRKITAAKQ